MKNVECPLCRSKQTCFWITKNGCDVYRCDECAFLFVSPIPDDLSKIYQEDYFQKTDDGGSFGYTDYDRDKEPMKELFLRYLTKFESLSFEKSIFDVGAATGYFLDLAHERGWKTAGSEISKFASREAEKRGHDIFQDELPAFVSSQKFSVVTMWDVLEHVRSPREYLLSANKILVSGGYVAINTPDVGSAWAKIMGKRWHLLVPPEHLHYFSEKNLKRLLEEAGFQTVERRKIGKKFSLSYIFETLYRWQGFETYRRASIFFNTAFWRKLEIPINLRDNIFILARKIHDE